MRTPLAWQNLASNKVRTLAAIGGVTFSVVLVFMQLGFLGSVGTTASLIYDALEFDIVLQSPEYLHVAAAGAVPRERLYQAASVPGVESVRGFSLAVNQWRVPASGKKRRILVMDVDPEAPVFNVPEIRRKAGLLRLPECALIDRQSRSEFGPKNGVRFTEEDVGRETEVGGRRVRLAGTFSLGSGFAADGAILMNERGFRRVFPGWGPNQVSLGLLKVAPGADVAEVEDRVKASMPEDVEVLSRREAIHREWKRWVMETSVGVIFFFGVVVALFVGTAIVYQVLSSDVANHLSEYATLKAIGYTNAYVAGVVLRQAVALAILGFAVGLVLSEVLYRFTAHYAMIPIGMTPWRVAGVLSLTLAMCTISGLGAIRKLRLAEPADLF